MTEEQVTKHIINKLEELDWSILSFDYPQSGTGIRIKASETKFPPIIFDIIAKKGTNIVFFENKDRYYPKDFQKLNTFSINFKKYENSFNKIFGINLSDFNIYTAIAFPENDTKKMKDEIKKLVDRIVLV